MVNHLKIILANQIIIQSLEMVEMGIASTVLNLPQVHVYQDIEMVEMVTVFLVLPQVFLHVLQITIMVEMVYV